MQVWLEETDTSDDSRSSQSDPAQCTLQVTYMRMTSLNAAGTCEVMPDVPGCVFIWQGIKSQTLLVTHGLLL